MNKVFTAFLDVRSFDDFEDLVRDLGERWDDDIILHLRMDWEDFGREYFEMCEMRIPETIENFIDFEAYGRYIGSDYAEEYENGIIEIFR